MHERNSAAPTKELVAAIEELKRILTAYEDAAEDWRNDASAAKPDRWEVWAEGYSATGEYARASRLAFNVAADSFPEAVQRVAELSPHFELYDLEKLTYWGCQLYPTEEEARRSYG